MNERQSTRSLATITAIGAYVPEKVLTNDDLAGMVETNDEWIVQRTGIRERRISAPDQYTSDLCFAAIENMMARYAVTVHDADLILVATHTPDFPFPSVACQIQARFDIASAGAVDLNATCAGFSYALHMANGLVTAGLHRKVLVVAADQMSRITDYTDRSTCILFGDGAGAALVENGAASPVFLGAHLGSNGAGGIHVYRTGFRSEWQGKPLQDTKMAVQNGREVYKWAVQTVPQGMRALAAETGVPLESVDWFVPHSANLRMVESICEKSGYPVDKTLVSMVRYGNTSAASIPLALSDAASEGKLKPGQTVLLYGFGGGLTHAGLLVRWPLREETLQ
ncbi:ketoacyl-ACP synthase III [Paenibacillus flagellatus]|uniref:Beta-ketoacyl-[acyl-carrier-protein] synthase III n=1 Tax=Paenibacillus flagellatus TaxID=2211139 RepID=A0A2V5KDY0_9BACL|nr:ketoacyl-ACP synthase III [Paenibacillus flagellatus]PYI52160.1 ketoacyl-ACP synthase III [Paenibacillus flagellatus]